MVSWPVARGHREAPNAYGTDVGSQSADTIKLNFIRCGRAGICWAARGPLNPRKAPRSFWETRSSIPRQLAARLEIVESGHFLLMSISAAEQAASHYLWIDGKERAMIICNPRSLAFALLIAALPVGFALAGGSGGRGGAIGAGVGAAGMGSAGVGGGAPAGSVGGGPPAGLVGGGSPNSNNAAGNGAAGTGNPSLNASVAARAEMAPIHREFQTPGQLEATSVAMAVRL